MYLLLSYAVTFGVLRVSSLCTCPALAKPLCVNSRNVYHYVKSAYKISV